MTFDEAMEIVKNGGTVRRKVISYKIVSLEKIKESTCRRCRYIPTEICTESDINATDWEDMSAISDKVWEVK